ncbi:hypothetical protein [Pseudomonas syringae]|uniref:Uncharacterized protein n=1 Tax=Pseudomonas syringae CC1417 TaxID=1357272 RepID=A0AAU8LF50_PSESX
MSDDKKTSALAEWHRILDDRSWWTNPSVAYRLLQAMASDLESAGLIDPLERFDLSELACAAFSYFTEEGNHEWRHQASDYLVHDASARVFGSMLHSRLIKHGAAENPYLTDHFAFLNAENVLIMRDYRPFGRLEGRHITTQAGETLTLVESGRQINGIKLQRLDDADQYRALIEAATLALERSDFDGYVKLWERHSYSIFKTCSTCLDRFWLREDCSPCAGRGFVEDPQRPDRLPPSLLAARLSDR